MHATCWAEQQAMRPGRIPCCSAPNSRPPTTKTLHTMCGNNTSIVSNSWWWAYKCAKHVEEILSTTQHSVASRWFSSPRLYNEARTDIHQIKKLLCLHENFSVWAYRRWKLGSTYSRLYRNQLWEGDVILYYNASVTVWKARIRLTAETLYFIFSQISDLFWTHSVTSFLLQSYI